jgi:hypothetical protein
MTRVRYVLVATAFGILACAAPQPRMPAAPSPAASPRSVTTPLVPPPHYAALFREGNGWTYVVKWSRDYGGIVDRRPPHESSTARVTCHVVRVAIFPEAIASDVDCDGSRQPVGGTWIASTRGLFHVEDALPENGLPEPKLWEFAFAASPHVERVDCNGTSDDTNRWQTREVKREGNAWCASLGECEGDDWFVMRCFAEGGIVRAAEHAYGGGTLTEIEYTLGRGLH